MSRRRPALVGVVVMVALVASGLTGASDVHVGADRSGPDARPVPATGVGGGVAGSATPADANASAVGDGPDVRVGVVGGSFDRSAPAIRDRIAAHRRIGDRLLAGAGSGEHGTAVAEIVADRTESAGLYLIAVGQRPTPAEYGRAVEWLVANDVDVIVDAGSYFPSTAAGMNRIATVAERAADDGTVFVTSAGNYARRHWRGTPVERGWVRFGDDTEANRLGNGTVDGTVTLRLYWEGDADYDLYLYRDLPGEDDPVVAKSTRSAGRAEAIDATLAEGAYYVGVYARDPGAGATPVDLFSASNRLAHAGVEGSAVAPATADGVISVGAAGGEIRPYSSAADVTAAGSVATDAAGRFRGTSAAAPVVAGAVARMQASGGDLTPTEVERALEATADDERRIDTTAALASARNGSVPTPRP